ncbi:MAG: LysM peptidoglycan-binding domain-containing protein [Acidimicrobiales bacterium]|nr:LysM peptidoglycan-binding domain-containing protein [Acidimicrobiales bacterium]
MQSNITRALAVPALAGAALFLSASPASAHESYTVRSGDTLGHIAARYDVSVAQIVAENNITNPNRIRVGQVLSIPHSSTSQASKPASTSAPAQGPKPVDPANFSGGTGSYQVVAGDSLSRIGARLGVSWQEIARLNNLSSPYRIRVGQTLKVPGAASNYPNLPSRILEDPARLAILPSLERWSQTYGVPTDLLMAVAWQESGWRNDQISSSGAFGIGQIMPATGEWIAASLIGDTSLSRIEPEDNIRMSAAYLGWLLKEMDTEDDAIAAYYQGQGSVRANGWYTSTHSYVANVTSHRAMFVSK